MPEPPAPSIIKTTPEQVVEIESAAIASAHSAAEDLSRASKVAPAPRCNVYRKLAVEIETTIRRL